MKKPPPTLFCTFCGKSQHEVDTLISGPKVFICDECVGACVNILKKPRPSPEIVTRRQAASDAYNRKDYKASVDLHLPLAKKGDADAQYWLGQSYMALEEYKKAFKWFQKSADQREAWNNGCSPQFQLGTMYKWGTGVKQNDEEAYFWYLVAERCGYHLADDTILTKNLNLEQIAAVNERVEKWLKAHPVPQWKP